MIKGTLRLSEPGEARRTAGGFGKLINDYAPVFVSSFGVRYFPVRLTSRCQTLPPYNKTWTFDGRRPISSSLVTNCSACRLTLATAKYGGACSMARNFRNRSIAGSSDESVQRCPRACWKLWPQRA